MNILLINHYAGSPEMGMEYRPYYLAREWNKLGHNVTIVAADYSHLRSKNPSIHESVHEKVIEQVRFVLIKTPVYTENDRKRYKNVYRFVQALNRNVQLLAEKYKPDIVIASSTYPFDIYPARKIAAITKAKLVYEVHDVHPDSFIEIYGYSSYHPIMLALRRAVKFAYRTADCVISILPKVDLHMKELGFETGNFTYIPNGIVEQEAPKKQPQRHIDLIARYRDKGYFIVMYLGGFAPANALDELVESAKDADRDVMYMLVGNGLHKAPLKRYAKQNNLSNIMYLDAVEKNQVQSILALADCLYIGALPLEVYRYGVGMNKLYDYMYSGRPIVCAMNVPENPVEAARCGIIVPENTGEQIAKAIGTMKQMSEPERAAMGERGRDYVMKNNLYSVLAKRFLDAVKQQKTEEKEKTATE
ncbi:glycosyltransferase family 4 protein [Hydrogenoanaerobacterium sp.]|uniref:glycosyltransferase family 4 protein n=1 Tax=Hydrogenoanaerobacterium sp. TaxID=2953763 RepID=UPI00289DC0AA|nr:glycosyltransferase family 4 protein [Hydrogenoanaerobacterium sp.]